MTNEMRRYCLRLLQAARQGDDGAHEQLVRVLAKHFGYMVHRFYSSDPSAGQDDLHQEFMLGIWRAVEHVDERGDPLYHLAQRGWWAMAAYATALRRRRNGANGDVSVGTLPVGYDLPDPDLHTDPEYVVELLESRDEARTHVAYVRARVALLPREAQTLEWMLHDNDPFEKGANKRLADRLGVSPQRASVLRKRVLQKLDGSKS